MAHREPRRCGAPTANGPCGLRWGHLHHCKSAAACARDSATVTIRVRRHRERAGLDGGQ